MNIEPVHTPCKSCVFAKYQDKTQIGCHIGYLDIYRNQGADIIEVYDNDLEFYVINQKKCVGYRENTWFIKDGLEDSTIENKIEYFYNLNKLNYLLSINFKEIGTTDESLHQLEDALANLEIHPKKIVFTRTNSLVDNTLYSNIQQLMTNTKINCPWRIQSMVDDTISNENILHSIINLNKPYRFICTIKSVPANLNRIINAGNEIVHNKLEQFKILSDQANSVLLFSAGVYRYSLAEKGEDILLNTGNYQII